MSINNYRSAFIVIFVAVLLSFAPSAFASASNIYLAQAQAGIANGSSCGNALPSTFFNAPGNWGSSTSQIGPGTTVHICGTITGSAGGTGFAFQGNGGSGNPVTLLFEPGAILQAPYWAASTNGGTCGGAIAMCGRSYVTVDGGSNGIVRNTANGNLLGNSRSSTGIDAGSCFSCAVHHLNIVNIYIQTTGGPATIDETSVRAITFNGTNWSIHDNVIHDCGWCLFDAYGAGDNNTNIYNNDIGNFGHGILYAAANPVASTNFFFHDNKVHDSANWTAPGCPYHQDGMHLFGVSGSSINGVYVYNNYFYGNYGTCVTGWVFVEGTAEGTPSNVSNSYWWNNVGKVVDAGIENTNGWFNISSGASGVTQLFNNTIVGSTVTDNTFCFVLINVTGLSFQDNATAGCANPVSISSSKITTVDNNFYGQACQNSGNCFVLNAGYTGSFAAWRAACNCDAHSVVSTTPLINPDGSPQAGSPVAGVGANLSSLALGSLAGLINDTSLGNTRTPVTRSASAAWTAGAYELGGGAVPPPISVTLNPPSSTLAAGAQQQFTATVTGSTLGVAWSLNPAVGSISSSGLYTAPASVTSTQNVQVIATAAADSTKTGTATVTLTAGVTTPISVAVIPNTATVVAGRGQQFVAAVTGSTAGVKWSLSPQMGSISTSGMYTAPASVVGQPTVRITATAVADTTKSATAALTITAAPVNCTATFNGTKVIITGPGGTQMTLTLARSTSGTATWTAAGATCP